MAGFIKNSARRVETTALNTQVNKRVFDAFKRKCKILGYPLNVMLETFMLQYTYGRFYLSEEEILRCKNDNGETDTLNTTFDKQLYKAFKSKCKEKGYFLKYVVTAFMERYVNNDLILEFRER